MRNLRTVRAWVLDHRSLSALIAALALVLVAVGLRLMTPHTADDHHAVASPAATSSGSATGAGPADTAEPTAVPVVPVSATADADVFARSVAYALFGWDTTSTDLPALTEQLLVVADPTGEETPGLLSDLRAYLPSPKAWTHLGRYQTRQWLEVTDIVEPAAWREALAQAPDGAVAEGTTARTVTGIRHRAGTWDGEPVAASSRVQFTVFLVCGPASDRCHLLRLSTPDAALH
ncbi:hypothetical protein ACO229_06570 [Promicromonospora sp. MS192]|uniref:hypothetical protein n=1 Tax=Promicromonospora sp. MS192 TaxID=3412684 RepID=UPI003C2C3E10